MRIDLTAVQDHGFEVAVHADTEEIRRRRKEEGERDRDLAHTADDIAREEDSDIPQVHGEATAADQVEAAMAANFELPNGRLPQQKYRQLRQSSWQMC